MTENKEILLPILAMLGLTIIAALWLLWARVGSVLRGKLDLRDVLKNGWPKGWITNAGDHFSNLFEVPVLFYVVCILAMVTQVSGGLFTVLAWVFVACRTAHFLIHVGPNHVPIRFLSFFAGTTVLIVMFVLFLVRSF